MTRLIPGAAFAAALLLTTGATAALPDYSTSFESPQFSVGEFPTGNNWTVQQTPVNVVAGTGSASTAQFVQLGSGAILDYSVGQSDPLPGDRVFVEGYFRGAGSDVTLAEANYPISQASAIVHFSSENGIEAWDGTKTGSAQPTSLDVPLGTANQDTWHKVTIALDFNAKTWDIWINNEKKNAAPFGFRDTEVTTLNGFKNLAQGGADFDGFRIVTAVGGDANGDNHVDSADVVRFVQYMTNEPTDDPILLASLNINSNGDNSGDLLNGNDLRLILNEVIGSSPTP